MLQLCLGSVAFSMNLDLSLMSKQTQKAAGILKDTHLKPLSEMFTEDELQGIRMDNKVGENYLGHFSEQLRRKGGSAYKAIGDRLVLKSSADLAFSEGAEKFLKDKELKPKKTEVDTVEADWSKAQKDVMRAKLSLTESETEACKRSIKKQAFVSVS